MKKYLAMPFILLFKVFFIIAFEIDKQYTWKHYNYLGDSVMLWNIMENIMKPASKKQEQKR